MIEGALRPKWFNHSILQYASQASYPFYLLHQTVLVAIAFYVVQWNLGITAKFLIISTATLVVTGILYDLLVKRINIARFFFGLKLRDTRAVKYNDDKTL
ncbi:hypothetical protein BV372_20490 [Nostoc sp. T09]|uniref:hypothetical protein n=1 Tax=Nostoc sp. T09 TaxID=1932621 RepID=UPI000A38B12C|nr:hypothetical protein [Nostoc sp. T09]OUL31338.1 hypothetical protein BV372_20490 [Nostoc sp. T09]